jgi:hypothetical protein
MERKKLMILRFILDHVVEHGQLPNGIDGATLLNLDAIIRRNRRQLTPECIRALQEKVEKKELDLEQFVLWRAMSSDKNLDEAFIVFDGDEVLNVMGVPIRRKQANRPEGDSQSLPTKAVPVIAATMGVNKRWVYRRLATIKDDPALGDRAEALGLQKDITTSSRWILLGRADVDAIAAMLKQVPAKRYEKRSGAPLSHRCQRLR